MCPTTRKEYVTCVSSSQYSPHQVVDDSIVLVLSCAIVGVKVDMLLPEAVHVKEEMQLADHCICPFSHVGQKMYLSRDCLAVDPKDGTLPRSEEVDGTWLHWVRWEVYLQNLVGIVINLEYGYIYLLPSFMLVSTVYILVMCAFLHSYRSYLLCVGKAIMGFDVHGILWNSRARKRRIKGTANSIMCPHGPRALVARRPIEGALILHHSQVLFSNTKSV